MSVFPNLLRRAMASIGETIGSLETIDLAQRFSENSIRLEQGRVNEMVFYEVHSQFSTSYTKMMALGEYFLYRYVSRRFKSKLTNKASNCSLLSRLILKKFIRKATSQK